VDHTLVMMMAHNILLKCT